MPDSAAVTSFAGQALRALRAALLACLLTPLAASVAAAGSTAAPPWDVAQSALCTTAVQEAERHHHFPPGLLASIAKVESGRPIASTRDIRAWPWSINADGTSLSFDSREQALAWARQGLAGGVRLLDVGCMQVNLQFHPTAFHSLEEAFDPASNVAYAARFLEQLGAETNGDWNRATGMYHSRTPDLAADYRNRVAEMGAGQLAGIGGAEAPYLRALRLPLAGGGVLIVNTHRQPSGHPLHLRSPCEIANVLAPLLHSPPRVSGCGLAAR